MSHDLLRELNEKYGQGGYRAARGKRVIDEIDANRRTADAARPKYLTKPLNRSGAALPQNTMSKAEMKKRITLPSVRAFADTK